MKLIYVAFIGLAGCVQLLGDFEAAGSEQDGSALDALEGTDGGTNASSGGGTPTDGSGAADAVTDGAIVTVADSGSVDGSNDASSVGVHDASGPIEAAPPALCCLNATQPSLQYGTCPAQSPPCGPTVYCDSRGLGWNCWTHPAGTSTDPAVCLSSNCCSAFVGMCP